MKTLQQTRTRLSIETLRVETFAAAPDREIVLEMGPTNPGVSMPPCCSQVYICI